MYVFIANGYKGIVESKQTLDILASIYPYPKFRHVGTKEAAIKFLNRYNRGEKQANFYNYGETDRDYCYATIRYVIDQQDLFITIDTSRVGFIRVANKNIRDTVIDNRPTMIRIRISNINLNDNLISDHCVAITTILELLGGYVDINIEVPDISVYLALTKYTGDNYIIKETQEVVKSRLGGVSITIK